MGRGKKQNIVRVVDTTYNQDVETPGCMLAVEMVGFSTVHGSRLCELPVHSVVRPWRTSSQGLQRSEFGLRFRTMTRLLRWLWGMAVTMMLLLAEISALSAFHSKHSSPTPETADNLNFHQVLQMVGKTCFRPGGTKATATLHEWAHLTSTDTAMELAAGLGTGGMALATKYGCQVLLTDRDEGRLEQAATVAAHNPAISKLIKTKYLDMLNMDMSDTIVDGTFIEASLTHFSLLQKKSILSQLQPHTKQLLLHEICLVSDTVSPEWAVAIKQEMGEALRIGFQPETLDDWRKILSESGFAVEKIQTGPIQLLNPLTLMEDEGVIGALTLAWNLARRPDLRNRVLLVRGLLHKHRHALQHILIRAVPK
jgi:hypothetical protein